MPWLSHKNHIKESAEVGVLLGDGAGSDVFSFTCQYTLAVKGTVEGHNVSGDAAACVGVSSKIAVNTPCQNVAVVGAKIP